MIETAVRIKELISSNIDAAVAKASDPAKMKRLLQTEIEEKIIALRGDLARLRRNADRASEAAGREAAEAEGWTDKARIAMDHGREDLARSALLARESGRLKAKELEAKVSAMAVEGAEIAEMLAALEAKHAHLLGVTADAPAADADGESAVDERLSRISKLESRLAFLTAGAEGAARDAASLEAEIAELQRDQSIDAELAEMRPAKTAAAKKTAARRTKAK